MSAANLLFVAGCGRSGTSALANYLNEHERILICIERYKYVPEEIDPTFFTFERILDYSERETNLSRERYTKLLEEKDPAKLKWIGDKTPGYHRYFGTLLENNPGARFLVTYRPVEEVAESFEARARNPQDRWPGEKNFEQGVGSWNRALRDTREFVESELKPKVLIVDYHDFFYRNELCVPLISRFLGLEFDKTVRGAWEARSRRYEDRRRRKEPLTEEQAKFVRANKDYAVEG